MVSFIPQQVADLLPEGSLRGGPGVAHILKAAVILLPICRHHTAVLVRHAGRVQAEVPVALPLHLPAPLRRFRLAFRSFCRRGTPLHSMRYPELPSILRVDSSNLSLSAAKVKCCVEI